MQTRRSISQLEYATEDDAQEMTDVTATIGNTTAITNANRETISKEIEGLTAKLEEKKVMALKFRMQAQQMESLKEEYEVNI